MQRQQHAAYALLAVAIVLVVAVGVWLTEAKGQGTTASAVAQPDAQTQLVIDEVVALRALVLQVHNAQLRWHDRHDARLTQLQPVTPEADSSLVNINTATAQELELLPHIGPVRAAAIVAARTEHGPFASIDYLVQVPGIGAATVEQLRPHITVGGGE